MYTEALHDSLALQWQLHHNLLMLTSDRGFNSTRLLAQVIEACRNHQVSLESCFVKQARTLRFELRTDPQSQTHLLQVLKDLRTPQKQYRSLTLPSKYQDFRVVMPRYENNSLFELARLLAENDVTVRHLHLDVDSPVNGESEVHVQGRLGMPGSLDLDHLQDEMMQVCLPGTRGSLQTLHTDRHASRDRLVVLSCPDPPP